MAVRANAVLPGRALGSETRMREVFSTTRGDLDEPEPERGELGPEGYARHAQAWLDAGARIIGCCCGTTPDHIARLHELVH